MKMNILKMVSLTDADYKMATLKVHFWDAGQLDDDSLAGGVFISIASSSSLLPLTLA